MQHPSATIEGRLAQKAIASLCENYICQAEESPGGLRDLPGCKKKVHLTVRCNALLVDGCADYDTGVRYNLALRLALSCVKEADDCSQCTAAAVRLVESEEASTTSRSKSACHDMSLKNNECKWKMVISTIREIHLRRWCHHVLHVLSNAMIMLKCNPVMLGVHNAHVCKSLCDTICQDMTGLLAEPSTSKSAYLCPSLPYPQQQVCHLTN